MRHVVLRSLLLAPLFGLVPAAVSAQEALIPGTFEFAPQGGVSFPSGNLADLVGTGYNVGGQLGFYATPQVAVGFGVLYNRFDLDSAIPDSVGSVLGGSLNIWEFTVFGKFLLTKTSVRPYLRVSAGGFYNDGVVNRGGPGNERVEGTSTRFGAGAGAGAQYRIPGSVGFFAEGMGMIDSTQDEVTVYYVLRGGLNIYFAWSHP